MRPTATAQSESDRDEAGSAPRTGPIALFVTCMTDTFFPHVAEAVVRVLRRLGRQVDFPAAQTCCGQPAFNSGFRAEAADLARRMIAVFEPYDHVVTPSASCAAMVCHEFPGLVNGDAQWRARAERLAARTFEFTVYLRKVLHLDIGTLLAPLSAGESRVTYHYPCHARDIYSVEDLHRDLTGLGERLCKATQVGECCGFGGAFSAEFPDVSGAMLTDKLDALSAGGVSEIVCNEAGCALHLRGGAHRRGLPLKFVHIAELLAQALDERPMKSQ